MWKPELHGYFGRMFHMQHVLLQAAAAISPLCITIK
jgi:hypothetical protein